MLVCARSFSRYTPTLAQGKVDRVGFRLSDFLFLKIAKKQTMSDNLPPVL